MRRQRRPTKPKQIAALIFLFVTLAVGVYYVALHHDRFAAILKVHPSGVALLVTLALLRWSIEASVLRLTVKELGTSVGSLESHFLVWTARYWNYLPMKPGTYALAVYMKRERGLTYSRFMAYLLAVNLVAIFSRGVLGLAVTVPIYLAGNVTLLIPALFATMVVLAVGAMAVPTRWTYSGQSLFLRTMSHVGYAWHHIRLSRGLLARIGLWTIAQSLVGIAYLSLCFRLVGIENSLREPLVAVLLTPVISLIGIVPGGLGVREALVGAVAMAFGGSFTGGVVAATLARVVTLSLLIILGPISSHRIFPHCAPSAGIEFEAESETAADQACERPYKSS